MENFELAKIEEHKDNETKALRKEVEELIKQTKDKYTKREKGVQPDLLEVNPDELIDEDLDIYKKFRDETLTFAEVQRYRQSIIEHVHKRVDVKPSYDFRKDSRQAFYAWLDNKWIDRKAVEKLIQRGKLKK